MSLPGSSASLGRLQVQLWGLAWQRLPTATRSRLLQAEAFSRAERVSGTGDVEPSPPWSSDRKGAWTEGRARVPIHGGFGAVPLESVIVIVSCLRVVACGQLAST
jgi:hypothetical protein